MSKINVCRPAEGKIYADRSKLAEAIGEAQSSGKTIVFTNGCFDILHLGHVRYLRKARDLGDALVVGVNTDSSVRKLKGPERPIVAETDRAEILASLECVDYVILFDEPNPSELIIAIKPDIDVKGGDYSVKDMPEAEAVFAYGGRIELIPFESIGTQGKSTTDLLGRMKK